MAIGLCHVSRNGGQRRWALDVSKVNPGSTRAEMREPEAIPDVLSYSQQEEV